MFGVVAFGSRQYKIEPGVFCSVDKIDGDVNSVIELDNLVLVSDNDEVITDKSRLCRYVVKARIDKQYLENKVIVYKFHRRKDYSKKQGHRQQQTLLRIESIELKN